MYICEARQLQSGDVILDPRTGRDLEVERVELRRDDVIVYHGNQHVTFFNDFRLAVLKRARPAGVTDESENAELKILADVFLGYLRIDADDDGSTQFLMSVSEAAHRLWHALGRVYAPAMCRRCQDVCGGT